MQIRTEAALFFKRVLCKFGMKEEVPLCCTIGANEKRGMDEAGFTKYAAVVLRKLYPDAVPEKGKWVILKCDGGPGRMNLDLLALLWLDGFHLFPGVLNTTAVTQETDQNYGPFKGAYARNHDKIVKELIAQGKTKLIPAWMVGLVIFWRTTRVAGVRISRQIFGGRMQTRVGKCRCGSPDSTVFER